MADNDNHHPLMESLLLCIGWPNTPGRPRLRRSLDLYYRIPDGGARGDSVHFSTCVQNARFGEWAGDLFQELMEQESGVSDYDLMAKVAAMGDSNDAIGLVVSGGTSEGGQTLFGRLHRDPQWMGLAPLLGTIEGLEARVFPAQVYRERPGVVVVAPHGSFGNRRDTGPFPPGPASTLKKLLEGHGAVPLWVLVHDAEDSGDGVEHRIRLSAYEAHNWPHTPTPDRLLRAELEVEQQIQKGTPLGINLEPEYGTDLTMTDAWHFLEQETRDIFRRWALEEAPRFMREMETSRTTLDVKDVLHGIARNADTVMTIGIAVFGPDPSGQNTHVMAFSRLSRDPDWMGFDGVLPKIGGLTALVHNSDWGSRLPGLVVVLPLPETFLASGILTDVPFPEGQATWLKEVLEFHGATPYWLEDTAPVETTRGR